MKKYFVIIRDCYEIVLPSIAMATMFIVFNYSIMSRYVFSRPVSWAMEIQALCYIYLVLPAAGYVRRINRHIAFPIVYERVGERGKRIMAMISNAIIGVTFTVLLPFAWNAVFNHTRLSPVLRFPMQLAYLPLIGFVASGAVYSFHDLFHGIRACTTRFARE